MTEKKYGNNNIVEAIYSDSDFSEKNPLIEAMPHLLNKDSYKKSVMSFPTLPYNIESMTMEKRREQVTLLSEVFFPMDYMYEIYDFLYRGIKLNYMTKNSIDYVRKINNLHYGHMSKNSIDECYCTQSFSGVILGVPGIGKTSTIRRSLSLIPQVISHEKYNNNPFYCKQITYLIVECPHDCSVRTLGYSIISAIDTITGADYLSQIIKKNKLSASTLAIKVKIICLNHHVGMIVIDEIQNAIQTASANRQIRPLIKFLVELTNEACISLCFSGTLDADNLFNREDHLIRRTGGYRLLPLKRDKTFYDFLKAIWQYQMTSIKTELNEKLANEIYGYSKGIPAYIIKIFQEAQIQAILYGKEMITESVIKSAVDRFHIAAYDSYGNGTSISDFCCIDIDTKNITLENRRGRPVTQRDSCDLIMLFKSASDSNQLITMLKEKGLLSSFGGEYDTFFSDTMPR